MGNGRTQPDKIVEAIGRLANLGKILIAAVLIAGLIFHFRIVSIENRLDATEVRWRDWIEIDKHALLARIMALETELYHLNKEDEDGE